MLRIFIFCFFIFFSLNAKSINWEKNYEEAKAKALKENKILFIMVSLPTCPECNYMKKRVFTQEKIKNYINENFISYQFEHESEEIPKAMKFWGIPRFYFSKDGVNVQAKAMGGLKADKLYDILVENIK